MGQHLLSLLGPTLVGYLSYIFLEKFQFVLISPVGPVEESLCLERKCKGYDLEIDGESTDRMRLKQMSLRFALARLSPRDRSRSPRP